MWNKVGVQVAVLVACVVLLSGPSAEAGSVSTTVDVTATVDSFFEWVDLDPEITVATPIGQTADSQEGSVGLSVYANVAATITPTKSTNDSVLTNGSDKLTTSYKVTGDVTNADADYLAAGSDGTGAFFTANTYTLNHSDADGAYTVTLGVNAESDAARANKAGSYTCSVILTASW